MSTVFLCQNTNPADSGFIKVVRLEVQQLPAIAPAAFGLPEYSFLSKLQLLFSWLSYISFTLYP